ncbi:MAG: ISKra4 family transposase [Anaerolineales bacterium]
MSPANKGFFPLDRQLAVWDGHWSEQIAKYAVWLGALVDFEDGAEILDRIGQIAMSDTSVWRRVKKWGARGQALESAQRAAATAMPARSENVAGEACQPQDMGVAMDGAMVNIRQEGWKELKAGCVFEIKVKPTRDRQTGDLIDLAHAIRNSYVAHLGGPEVFGQSLWAAARARGWTQARDTLALGDGAAWIWNLVKDHFYDSRQGVDWYHATQHLWKVAHLLHGEGTAAAKQWFKDYETPLFEGHADRLAQLIRTLAATHPTVADALRTEANYFDEHQRRMQYLELREDGFPIGSGMVESACKQFRARFNGPGMRWSRPGLERLLPVRAAVMGHTFDHWWKAVYNPPLN